MLKEVLALVLFVGAIMTPRAHAGDHGPSQSSDYRQSVLKISPEVSTDSDPKIILVFPPELSPMQKELEKITEIALTQASQRLQLKLRDNVSVFFDTRVIDHNGLTTVIPKNRILIYPEAPEADSSIGFSEDYLRETLVHEFGHMLAIQQRDGAFATLSYLFGTAARPIGLWPRWIHEGLAVWTEEVTGGRPKSGAIDRDLRLYQEYSQRNKKFWLKSDHMNGDLESTSIPGGRIPYSFGYLLMQKIHAEVGPQQWMKESSKSLGISFRPTLKSLKFNLDEQFRKLQEEWKSAPPKTPAVEWISLSKSKHIKGPFRMNDSAFWIEQNSNDGRTQLVSLNPILGPQKIVAPDNLGAIQQAFGLESGEWILLVKTFDDESVGPFFNPNRPIKTRLGIWRPGERNFRCIFKVGNRVRETSFDGDLIFWVSSEANGQMNLQSAHWNESCEFADSNLITTSRSNYERISGPSRSQEILAWSQSQGRDLFSESIHLFNGKNFQIQDPLTNPQFIDSENLVAMQVNRNHWGPTLIDLKLKTLRPIPTKTSIRNFVVIRDNIIALQEFWDSEEIVKMPLNLARSISPVPAEAAIATPAEFQTPEVENLQPEVSSQPYKALADTWPSFWNPIAGSDGSGFFVAGSSFYSDLSGFYSGATSGGYSSLTKKGFFHSQLKLNFENEFPTPSPLISFSYTPRYLGDTTHNQLAQDQLRTSLLISYPAQWQHLYFLNLGFALSYEWQEKTFNYNSGRFWIPGLSLSLRDRKGRDPNRAPNSLTDAKWSFFSSGRVRRIKDLEGSLLLNVEHPWHKKTGGRWVAEGAFTSAENFPYSYFVLGGNSLINTQDQSAYLTRGYPYRFGLAQGVLRFCHETDFQLATRVGSLGWSRFKVDTINLRLIAETVTFDGFKTKTKFTDHYFHTLGAELRAYGKTLGYVEYEAAIGYYRGLSNPQSNQYSITLRSWLDL